MKKVLMVLSLAMCASFAFAQTNVGVLNARQAKQNAISAPKAEAVDYKASIFAKPGDTIQTWRFDSEHMTGITYGTSAVLSATDVIQDTTVGSSAHSLNTNYAVWQRISDSASMYSDNFQSTYPILSTDYSNYLNYFLAPRVSAVNVGDDNGFMLIVMIEQRSRSGNYNAYVGFPAVTTPADCGVIDIAFLQAYYNFYDQCFIDYKINGNWKTREINVDGVDCDINGAAAYRAHYTMPLNLAQQSNIEIRMRCYADGAGAAYGYLWAIDNVSIVAYPANTDRVRTYAEEYIDGAYGTIPQGMNIPLTWAADVANTGTVNQTNVNIQMSHIYFDGNGQMQTSTILTAPQATLNAGDPDATSTLVVDERGFYYEDFHGWFGYSSVYGNSGHGSYGGHGLPTTNAGYNYVTATLTTSNMTEEWDTILYRVSDASEEFDANSGMIEGYRWAHDNGLIPSGSQYAFMWTDDGYVTESTSSSDHWKKANYMVLTRYTTGDVIPQGWVIRGVEMIPATTESVISNAAGAQFTVEMFTDDYTEDGESFSFGNVNTGVTNAIQEVSRDQINILENGYIVPGQEYNAINVFFPNQPELLPNTSYHVGYSLTRDGEFGVAGTAYSYIHENGNSTAYYNNETTAPFYNQFTAAPAYDVYIYDPNTPTGRRANLAASAYEENYPMIRLIVGPALELPSTNVYAICDGAGVDTGYVITNAAGENVCGDAVSCAIGYNHTFYIYPSSDHMMIDSIYIDGRKVTPYDEGDPSSDENCFTQAYNVMDENEENVLLYREFYGYQFENIQASAEGHRIQAFTSWHDFQEVGIDPVAANVSLGLSPNPATNSVKLNIKGVTGMVNCNIIDMSGRVIYNANINAEEQHVVSLNNVPAGAYFVRVTNNNFSKVEKLIVR